MGKGGVLCFFIVGLIPPPPSRSFPPQILEPLRLACACSDARVVEPALACLHKLVRERGKREGRAERERGNHTSER